MSLLGLEPTPLGSHSTSELLGLGIACNCLKSLFVFSFPGGLFHSTDSKQEQAFLFAVDRINADRFIIPKSKISAQVEEITPYDSFHASKRVCHLLRTGVAAVFGPQSSQTASHVQAICDTMEIPHLETRWDYRLRRESCLVNLYPHPNTLSKVCPFFKSLILFCASVILSFLRLTTKETSMRLKFGIR